MQSASFKAFISNNMFYSVLGCSGHSSMAGVEGPRITEHVLLEDVYNSQFLSSVL